MMPEEEQLRPRRRARHVLLPRVFAALFARCIGDVKRVRSVPLPEVLSENRVVALATATPKAPSRESATGVSVFGRCTGRRGVVANPSHAVCRALSPVRP